MLAEPLIRSKEIIKRKGLRPCENGWQGFLTLLGLELSDLLVNLFVASHQAEMPPYARPIGPVSRDG